MLWVNFKGKVLAWAVSVTKNRTRRVTLDMFTIFWLWRGGDFKYKRSGSSYAPFSYAKPFECVFCMHLRGNLTEENLHLCSSWIGMQREQGALEHPLIFAVTPMPMTSNHTGSWNNIIRNHTASSARTIDLKLGRPLVRIINSSEDPCDYYCCQNVDPSFAHEPLEVYWKNWPLN